MNHDYVPRFKVGDRVTHNLALDSEVAGTITERRVYRSKKYGNGDTFYVLDTPHPSGTGQVQGWEWSMSPTTDKVAPSVAFQRVVDAFAPKAKASELVVKDAYVTDDGTQVSSVEVTITTYAGPVVHLFAWVYNGKVETIGAWDWRISGSGYVTNGDRYGSDTNLGGAIVTTYNLALANAS